MYETSPDACGVSCRVRAGDWPGRTGMRLSPQACRRSCVKITATGSSRRTIFFCGSPTPARRIMCSAAVRGLGAGLGGHPGEASQDQRHRKTRCDEPHNRVPLLTPGKPYSTSINTESVMLHSHSRAFPPATRGYAGCTRPPRRCEGRRCLVSNLSTRYSEISDPTTLQAAGRGTDRDALPGAHAGPGGRLDMSTASVPMPAGSPILRTGATRRDSTPATSIRVPTAQST